MVLAAKLVVVAVVVLEAPEAVGGAGTGAAA
jgi:hypothetical protein